MAKRMALSQADTGDEVGGEFAFAQRLDQLHQLLYTRGGIRPSNAAVEELTKLLLLRIAAERHPDLPVDKFGSLADLLNPKTIPGLSDVQPFKQAFLLANRLPDLGGKVPGGDVQPVWPLDEPLRISRLDVIAEAVDVLSSIELGTGEAFDPAGTAFDVFLRKGYQHAGGLGTYLTPATVVRSMVELAFDLVDPLLITEKDSPAMGDPCCGSGRFLVGLIEETRRRTGLENVGTLSQLVFGADQSASTVAMARVNLLAYGLSHPEVFVVQDSITDPSLDLVRRKLLLILTNPPFGDGKYDSSSGIARATTFFPTLAGKNRIDPALAFVARCVDLLAPGGVAGIILPDGVLDGVHMRDVLLRSARLTDEVHLEGIVSLPSATFAPAGTTAKTSILFIRRAAPDRTGRVFLARADHVGYLFRKGTTVPDPDGDDLPQVTAAVSSLLKGADIAAERGHVSTAPVSALASLDASSIDEEALQARATLISAGGHRFAEILSGVRKRRADPQNGIPFVSVLHVDELGNVDWLEATRYAPTTPGVVARSGEILVSLLNPRKFRATVVPESFNVIHCSAEFGIFATELDSYAVLALLQNPLVRAQIAPLGRGTSSSRRRIETEDILSLIAPPVDDDWLAKVARRVQDALASIAEARERLMNTYSGSLE